MKKILTIISLLLCVCNLFGQTFRTLHPKDYPIGEVLPLYTELINLGYNVSEKDVEVCVEYPEFADLTSEEVRLLENFNHSLPSDITPQLQYGIERKSGVLEVGVLPFIIKNGKPKRITSLRIQIQHKVSAARSPKTANNKTLRYAPQSVLANGKWVKIKVQEEGIYQLTQDLIKSWGFSDIQKIKVYGYGGRILPQTLDFSTANALIDDLKEVATYRESNRLLFFAEGTVRFTWQTNQKVWSHENNHYSDASYYFVTEGEEPLQIQVEKNEHDGEIISVINHPALYDKDAYAWYEGGRQFHDAYNFVSGNSKTYTVETPSATEGSAQINFTFSASSVAGATALEVSCNNKTVRDNIRACLANESAIELKKNFVVDNLSNSTNVKFVTTANKNARLNYILITYPRLLSAQDKPFSFIPNPAKTEKNILHIANATANTQLWHINQSTNEITQIESNLDNTTLVAPVRNSRDRYIVVNVNQTFRAPTFVENVNSQNLHADEKIDMVIVVPESGIFDEQAQRLALAHETHSSLRTKVVHQNEIFNEFSSGTPDATAIRRYLKMLYDKAADIESAPKYLLLFGDCLYDNRMVLEANKNLSAQDFLLSYEDNDNYRNSLVTSIGDLLSYPTDDYFGLLDDGEGNAPKVEKIDIAIGRFVCKTATHAKILVDKTINYLENKSVGNWKNRIVTIGDAKDQNSHMEDAERVISTINNATENAFNIKRIYPDLYTRQVTGIGYRYPKAKEILTEDIKKGALIFNYSGHGSPNQISHAFIFETEDWESVSSKALPLWILASCEILPYDQDKNDFAREALLKPDGGGVAFMCASRAVYASENNHLNTAYCDFLMRPNTDGSYNSIGEALRLAKNQLITLGKDRTINKLKYILAGDPALPLNFPKEIVEIDSINGKEITAGKTFQLKAGSIATFSGSIKDKIDGVATAILYDVVESHVCKNNDGSAETPFTYQERTKIIYEGSDSIKDGKFTFRIPIPKDINYSNECGRLSVYAVSNDHKIEAHGHNESFFMNGSANDTASADSVGPESYIYLDYPEFPNGGLTNSNPLFVALLSDSSGINSTGISLGHDIELCIDNDYNNIYVLNDYFNYDFGSYQKGKVEYQLKDLEPGRHTLNFRVWDLNNNPTIQSLNFVVGSNELISRPLYATVNPANTSTKFVAQTSEEHIGGVATFEVYTLLGKKIWSMSKEILSNTITIDWHLTNNQGTAIPKGLYLYRVVIESPTSKEETDAERIIIY